MQETQRIEVIDRGMLCKSMARRLGMTISDINQIVNIMQSEIQEDIREGKKVQLNGFLIFTPKNIKGGEMKSPLDGKTYQMPPKRSVEVKVGKEFKDYIRDGYKGEEEEIKPDAKSQHRGRAKSAKSADSE